MSKPIETIFNGNIEAFLSDKRVIWLKYPSYGMSNELNRLYHKTKMRHAMLNTATESDKDNVLHVIQTILSDKNIAYVNKLHLINELIEVSKDYFDKYDTIIDDAIACQKDR